MTDKKQSTIKSWLRPIRKKVYRRDLIIAIVCIFIGLITTDLYNYAWGYFTSSEVKVALSFWSKHKYISNISDSTKIVTYKKDAFNDCVHSSIQYKALRGRISSTLNPSHSAGLIVSNTGGTAATDVEIFFDLEAPGDSLSLKKTYQADISISENRTPVIGQKGQLIKVDHIDPNSYEVIVVSRFDTTSSSGYVGEHDASFEFYSLNHAETAEPITQVDRVSLAQLRRAIESKSNASEFKTIDAPFETHSPTGKTDVSATLGVANTCVQSLPDVPWFEKNRSWF